MYVLLRKAGDAVRIVVGGREGELFQYVEKLVYLAETGIDSTASRALHAGAEPRFLEIVSPGVGCQQDQALDVIQQPGQLGFFRVKR